MQKFFKILLLRLSLWMFYKCYPLLKINLIKDVQKFYVKKMPDSIGEINHNIFVAYEAGRHEIMWRLTHFDFKNLK